MTDYPFPYPEPHSKSPFVSIRIRFLGIFCAVMLCILLASCLIIPTLLTQYFISEHNRLVQDTYEVMNEVLENEDPRINVEAAKIMEAAARSSGVSAWFCSEIHENTVEITVFGDIPGDTEKIDFSSFSTEEKNLIRRVVEGEPLKPSIGVFSSAFTDNTLSVGYPQLYVEETQLRIGPSSSSLKVERQGALILHEPMSEIRVTTRTIAVLVISMLLLVAIASTIMMTVMGNNILVPLHQMKSAAEAISRGDYSQEVEVRSSDEVGQLTQAFNRMSKDLSQMDTLQKDFIANISHDFRSPLTSIKGYVEAMLDGTIPEESFPKYLQIVLDEANRLTKMTNNVLDLTKMENGQIELKISDFDINEMIVGLALSFEQRVEEKRLSMQFHFLEEKLFVSADLSLIQRVIYNLLDNALKFTGESGTIVVETSIVGKKALISVADNGEGIEEEALSHVFDRFNKGDKSRGMNKMGTGLGLAIAKQILSSHGEDISVRSKLGEGTRFFFSLPLANHKGN